MIDESTQKIYSKLLASFDEYEISILAVSISYREGNLIKEAIQSSSFSHIITLEFSSCNIDHRGALQLSEILKSNSHSNLKTMILDKCKLDCSCISFFGDAIRVNSTLNIEFER